MTLQGVLTAKLPPTSTTPSSARRRAVHGGELGGFRDNESAFFVAKGYIDNGEVETGLELLERLRKHIERTRDPKSIRVLLPAVGFLLSR